MRQYDLKNNVCPCVSRSTVSRDRFIVLESHNFSELVYEVVINTLLSLPIFPQGDHLAAGRKGRLIILSIVSIMPPITTPGVPRSYRTLADHGVQKHPCPVLHRDAT